MAAKPFLGITFAVGSLSGMSGVTHLLERGGKGDAKAAELRPLVYRELRRLAAHLMTCESLGHTLQPTALVHEAWLCLNEEADFGVLSKIRLVVRG